MPKRFEKTCAHCHLSFICRDSWAFARQKYCSHKCFYPNKPRTPIEVRFWRNVQKSPDPEGCWIWKGTVNNKGYGRIGDPSSKNGGVYVHRLSYSLHYGDIDHDLGVLHRCDTPTCVNPAHLFTGTQADNMRDCANKKRNQFGEAHARARLTDADVITIRRRYAAGGITHQSLADEYRVARQHMSGIISGRFWKTSL